MNKNIILLTDSYKVCHHKQYPPDTQTVYSYFESRTGAQWEETVFFGLQYLLKEYFEGPVVTKEKIDYAEQRWTKHFGSNQWFNRAGWEHILDKHGGNLPVRIKAVPEGTVVPVSNVLMTVENTDPLCWWLTNYIETALTWVWYPCTVATQSREMKKILAYYLRRCGGDVNKLPFMLHDFGFRGVTCYEQARIGGCAHLTSFWGTDTSAGFEHAYDYYGCDMAGFSIPAYEHSTVTSWGKFRETDCVEHALEVYKDSMFSIVADSYDTFAFCSNILSSKLKDKILKRKHALVVRPDCYDEETEILTPRGWVRFSELSDTDDVAQVDDRQNISFVKPESIIKQKYNGEMYHFTTDRGNIDLMVTPNHRMVRRNSITGKIEVCEAEKAKWHYQWKHLVAGYKPNGVIGISPFERLLIAFQADGSFESGHDEQNQSQVDGTRVLRFNFSKKRKVERLKWICELGNFTYKISVEKSRPNNTQVYVYVDKQVYKTFDWVDLDKVSYRWGQEFVEELSYWDATRRHEQRFKYDTTVEINAVKVQQICVLSGYKTHYSITVDNRQPHYSDVHTLHICKKHEIDTQAVEINIVPYDGTVYCVKVPTGMLLVRRNKVVSVSGNSGDPKVIINRLLDILGAVFGYTTVIHDGQPFKLLSPCVRIIQGDGIDFKSLAEICESLYNREWSVENLAFGSGGGLLQKLNRDTQRFAFKCSSVTVNGVEQDVSKNPSTDPTKASKAGRLWLQRKSWGNNTCEWHTKRDLGEEYDDVLETVFLNGSVIKSYDFDSIRKRAIYNG